MKYPKIKTLFKRDPETNYKTLIDGKYSMPEFEYLQHCDWLFTEKIHGQNIRVMWDGSEVTFGGRGSKSDKLYKPLLEKLKIRFYKDKLKEVLGENFHCTLYGEGCGARIQKGGENYFPDGVDYILFDINWGGIWLHKEDVWNIASRLSIQRVPIIDVGPLSTMVELVKRPLVSCFGDFEAEGLVAQPLRQVMDFQGRRVITKLKGKDFKANK